MGIGPAGSENAPLSAATELGTATLSPAALVEAGSRGTWTLVYTAGRYGLDDGGSLLVAARQMADWGPPQTTNAAAANYISATTTAEATLAVHFSPQAYIRPWRQGIIVTGWTGMSRWAIPSRSSWVIAGAGGRTC